MPKFKQEIPSSEISIYQEISPVFFLSFSPLFSARTENKRMPHDLVVWNDFKESLIMFVLSLLYVTWLCVWRIKYCFNLIIDWSFAKLIKEILYYVVIFSFCPVKARQHMELKNWIYECILKCIFFELRYYKELEFPGSIIWN